MFFCPNCSYLFDINKTGNTDENKIVLSKITDIFDKLEDNDNMKSYKTMITKEEIIKNKKYLKLNDKQKENINNLYNENISTSAEFKCNNCNNIKPITETIILYQLINDDKIIKVKDIEENKLLSNDPLLPRTNNYTCKNKSCKTIKNPELKEAVFYKDKNSYKVNYICTICYFNW